MTSIFICCALHDAPFAKRLGDALRQRGFQIVPMDAADAADFSAIRRADVVVFLLGHRTLDSGRVRDELQYARWLYKTVIGILVEDDLRSNDIDRRFRWVWTLLWIKMLPQDDLPDDMVYELVEEGFEWAFGAVKRLERHTRLDRVEQEPASAPPIEPDEYEPASAPPIETREDPPAIVIGDVRGSTVGALNPLGIALATMSAPASADAMARASEETPATAADMVDCSVFAPDTCEPRTWIFVQAYFHTPKQAADAAALAEEFDPGTTRRGFAGLQLPIHTGCVLDVELDIDGVRVPEPVQRLAWRGRAEAVQFDAQVPADQAAGPLRGAVVVRRDGIPVGRVGFRVMVEHAPKGPVSRRQAENPIRFSSAFISYASPDRDEVLRRVQALQAVGIAFFQDLLSLDPGARWKSETYRHIDESDLFLLFWSKAAKKSKWVRREADRALQLQSSNARQLPEIRPVILGRPVVMPWKELRHLHFNDRLIFLLDD